MKTISAILLIFTLLSCRQEKHHYVDLNTNYGVITVKLFNETPRHRDNFTKLAASNHYDSILFHRVINEFMIQSGDPKSKQAVDSILLGDGDLPYQVEKEIVYPKHFHQRGILAAAREGDDVNPKKGSSASHFYIVTGKIFSDSLLNHIENRKTIALHKQRLHELEETYQDSIARLKGNSISLKKLLCKLTKESQLDSFKFPASHRAIYKTKGGTPHLDGEYTVYGEVIKGMNVVDSIQQVTVDKNDRPLKNIRILSTKVRVE